MVFVHLQDVAIADLMVSPDPAAVRGQLAAVNRSLSQARRPKTAILPCWTQFRRTFVKIAV
jgi:hypothetical protein